MSVLLTGQGAYRATRAGTYRDDPWYRVKPGDSWLNPADAKDNGAEAGQQEQEPATHLEAPYC